MQGQYDTLTHQTYVCLQGGPAKVRPTYIFAGTWTCR